MAMLPTDYRTWTALADHPIFGPAKSLITDWSADPSQYCDLTSYSDFMPECYVHVDPAPPESEQRAIATRDLANLRDACRQITEFYGPSIHELVILNDFTVFIWLKNHRFHITVYPMLGLENHMLMLFIESPVSIEELPCDTIEELLSYLDVHSGT
ncbi:hypothetical protein N9Y42_10775 [Mariniblastus sp.]|nr:hypothetical protein [Mariniblastus sp.]